MSRRRRPSSVRVRILAAVLVTTLLGMIGAGIASYLISRQATYEGIRKALGQENEEIKTVARIAEEGKGGRPVRGPSDVLYIAIQSTVPDPGEAILGLVNGKVQWIPDSTDAFQRSLATDPELVRAAAAITPDQPVQVYRLSTPQHDALAYVSIPITVRGSGDLGHYVAVVDVDAAFVPVNRTHLTYAVVCLVSLGLVALVGYQVAGRLLHPLRSLQRTAQRINETDLSDRIPADQLASDDEVADLGRTMNAMLDRLSVSSDTQRQILDDAGHELRTPITIVRGHLELVDPADPDDVARTRDLAIEELDRMQRMVEEILLLAKSKRPDFVRPGPVVVADLLSAVLDKVTPLAQRTWLVDAVVEDVVELDQQRVTQALVQLVANAVRFTPDGAVIALGADRSGGDLRLWVRDEGTGIADADRERIFERFGRGASPGGSDRPDFGAGLGLAIVSAIAAAHRGRVELSSELGHGSTFRLILPLAAARPDSRPSAPTPTSTGKEPAWPRS